MLFRSTGGTYTATDRNDVITGSAGVDSIALKAGNDWVEGKGGADLIAGGLGADTFVYRSASDSYITSTSSVMDRITDFLPLSQGDRIGVVAVPSKLWNAGTLSGSSVYSTLSAAMTNALAQVGSQSALNGTAVMVSLGTATYLLVSDNVSGLGSGDLAIQLNQQSNADPANPFNNVGYVNPALVFANV